MPGSPLTLHGIEPATFLRESWQRRAALFRDALPGFVCPLSPDELGGLACEPGVESRLIREVGEEGAPWTVEHGPFESAVLEALPGSGWSLLVHQVDRWIDAVADLLEPFRFLPSWRIDDVMISLAPDGGSVGAHIDAYDVFLLQGWGRRRWSIEPTPRAHVEIRPDAEARVLREFQPTESWELEPGDCLYLPPGLAHHGVAVGTCMTLSIGFRAPAQGELVAAWAADRIAMPTGPRYRDPDRLTSATPGRIEADVLKTMADWLEATTGNREALEQWVGAFLTRGRSDNHGVDEDEPMDLSALLLLDDEVERAEAAVEDQPSPPVLSYRRSAPSHFAYTLRPDGSVWLFVGGACYPCPDFERETIQHLCTAPVLDAAWVEGLARRSGWADRIQSWIDDGWLLPIEADA